MSNSKVLVSISSSNKPARAGLVDPTLKDILIFATNKLKIKAKVNYTIIKCFTPSGLGE